MRTHSADLATTNLYAVTDALYAKRLILQETKIDIYSITGESDSRKVGKLLIILEQQLESSCDPDQYLIDTCHVLMNKKIAIADSILHSIGKYILISIPFLYSGSNRS